MKIAVKGQVAMTTYLFACYRRASIFFTRTSALAGSEYAVVLGLVALIALGAAATLGTGIADTMDIIHDMLDQNHVRILD